MAAYIRMKTANTNYKIVVVFLLLVRNDGAVEKAVACYQSTPNFKLEGKAIVVWICSPLLWEEQNQNEQRWTWTASLLTDKYLDLGAVFLEGRRS